MNAMLRYTELFQELLCNESSTMDFGGKAVQVRLVRDGSQIHISTSVFGDGSYIPPSVRRFVVENPRLGLEKIETTAMIQKDKRQVWLHYLGDAETLHVEEFEYMIEEFMMIADEWRLRLEDEGKKDYVYVRVPK